MKKFLTLLLVCVLLLTVMTACGGAANPAEDPVSPDNSDVTPNNNAEVPDSEQDTGSLSGDISSASTDLPQRNAFAVTPEECKVKLAELIDMSMYEIQQYEDMPDYIGFDLDSAYDHNYNFDYTVAFAGTAIKLPVTFHEMENSGWTTEASGDLQISNKVQQGVTYTNGYGQQIILWTTNLDDVDADEDLNCDLSECTYYDIQIDVCTKETEQADNGEYVTVFKKNPVAPNFLIGGSVSESSSIADVINAFGAPSQIDFNANLNSITVCYLVVENNWFSNLTFRFAADGDYIVSVNYEYSL